MTYKHIQQQILLYVITTLAMNKVRRGNTDAIFENIFANLASSTLNI